jgi:cell wall-associated NlpC family hydrolase
MDGSSLRQLRKSRAILESMYLPNVLSEARRLNLTLSRNFLTALLSVAALATCAGVVVPRQALAQVPAAPPDTSAIDRELSGVLERLEDLGRQEEIATEMYLRAEDELAKAIAAESAVSAEAARARERLDRSSRLLALRLVQAYKRGPDLEIKLVPVMEGRSMAQLGLATKITSKLVEEDNRAVASFRDQEAELREIEAELGKIREQKQFLANESQRRLGEIRQAVAAAEAYRRNLEERKRRMLAEYEEAQRRAQEAARQSITSTSGRFRVTGASSERVARAVEIALAQLGKPYRYGAAGPDAFDCSGLVLYAFSSAGFGGIPHRADLQYFLSDIHPRREELRPGDLVFFSSAGTAEGIHHNGIYIGDGMMVHAPQTGDVVKLSSIARKDYFGATRLA